MTAILPPSTTSTKPDKAELAKRILEHEVHEDYPRAEYKIEPGHRQKQPLTFGELLNSASSDELVTLLANELNTFEAIDGLRLRRALTKLTDNQTLDDLDRSGIRQSLLLANSFANIIKGKSNDIKLNEAYDIPPCVLPNAEVRMSDDGLYDRHLARARNHSHIAHRIRKDVIPMLETLAAELKLAPIHPRQEQSPGR